MSARPGRAQATHTPQRRPNLDWQDEAICTQADPRAFFPGKGPGTSEAAKRVCGNCPVQDECLTHAIEHGERWGVWGGLSEVERRHVKRARHAMGAA